jgi:CheY-like chemotaxis protein
VELNKILLVDDDATFNFLNKAALKQFGISCSIDEALNGKKALEYIMSHECPDVLLLDLNMPVMAGIEFLKEYQKQARCIEHTKVYILTSSLRDEDKMAIMKFSCVKGYFPKPLSADHVEAIKSGFQPKVGN